MKSEVLLQVFKFLFVSTHEVTYLVGHVRSRRILFSLMALNYPHVG